MLARTWRFSGEAVKSFALRNENRMKAKAARPKGRSLAASAVSAESSEEVASIPSAGGQGMSARLVFGIAVAVSAAVVWSYWPLLADMVRKWSEDPQYSHAYLAPAFAGYLLWFRRPLAAPAAWGPNWWGLPVLAGGVLMRLAGAFLYFDWLESVSLLPVLAGAVLLIAGPRALRWAWPAVAFLAFMIPLPYRVETALSQPLQRMATLVSTYVLQTVGRPAFAEGNVIVVNDARIGVVEACNGLGMLMLFFALATAMAIVVRRDMVEKAVIVASAAPVAVAANVARITATSFAHEYLNGRWADLVFHDLAGWLMMPLALGLLWLEMQIVSRLFVPKAPRERLSLVSGPPARAPGSIPVERAAP
jgi:exosortase